ncbi:hypothetical protein [Saccharomonospora cyanea]|uniref:Uncharacterized protein n=1 Tax=Saccharomonospora cyanea NA-134 TaxID=882082 RepID=H5XMD8_9PSEU|nr:hypothetical protein [Saccharomonospora cyanea]EHR59887.1 hypothetical protein SaccyDRAFT_0974 [Saccharomonospora cyanea NA-134]
MRDIDPTQTEAVEPGDTVAAGVSAASGVVVTTSFDDDDDLEPTIVRGRE